VTKNKTARARKNREVARANNKQRSGKRTITTWRTEQKNKNGGQAVQTSPSHAQSESDLNQLEAQSEIRGGTCDE